MAVPQQRAENPAPAAPSEGLLADIEARAAEMAREAGAILAGHFGRGKLKVEFKDEKQRDPVTNADKECQELLEGAIAKHFPDHGVLGEEGEDKKAEESPAPDFVWVLDPLDGTKNFMGGLPVYASSVGVMYRGVPIVGAVFVPWPSDGGGVVLHARTGGGAFADDEPISVAEFEEPKGNSLVTLPGSFGAAYRFRKPMNGKVGEVRVTGSIAYELAMTARGVLQYAVTTGPHLWDVAGGVVLVAEAGGLIMRRRRSDRLGGLIHETRWEPMNSFVSTWDSSVPAMKELRRWSASMVLGSPGVVRNVTSNLRPRTLLRHRLRRAVRAWRGKRGPTAH